MSKKTTYRKVTAYTQEIADEICARIAEGMSLTSLLRCKGMPCMITVQRWMRENEVFMTAYRRAKLDSADAHADKILDIADNDVDVDNATSVQHAKLRIDTRKWIAGKYKPAKYGDKVEQTILGDLKITKIERKIIN